MKRKIIVIVLAIVLIIGIMPTTALAIFMYHSVEEAQLRDFLDSMSDDGSTTNGLQISSGYLSGDPGTWAGVVWDDTIEIRRVLTIGESGEWNGNSLAGELDLSMFTSLNYLGCSGNQISSIDVTGCVLLSYIYAARNALADINVEGCTVLAHLSCHNNELTELVLSDNIGLLSLFCGDNDLMELDVSANTNLSILDLEYNNLTTIDISMLTNLTGFGCEGNDMGVLNLTDNTELTIIYCGKSGLDALDVSANTKLEYLSCFNNNLTELDLSQNSLLIFLECNSNQLTELDLRANPLLTALYCVDNPLTKIYADIADGDYDIDSLGNGYISLQSNSLNGAASVQTDSQYEALGEPLYELDGDGWTIKATAYPNNPAVFVNWTGTETLGEPPSGPDSVFSPDAEPELADTEVFVLTAGNSYTMTANMLSLDPPTADIYVGGRVTLTPSIGGGVWSFDQEALSAEAAGDAKNMTGEELGIVRVTYTLGEKSTYSDINVKTSGMPGTGQDFTWVIILGALALAALGGALLIGRKKRQKA